MSISSTKTSFFTQKPVDHLSEPIPDSNPFQKQINEIVTVCNNISTTGFDKIKCVLSIDANNLNGLMIGFAGFSSV